MARLTISCGTKVRSRRFKKHFVCFDGELRKCFYFLKAFSAALKLQWRRKKKAVSSSVRESVLNYQGLILILAPNAVLHKTNCGKRYRLHNISFANVTSLLAWDFHHFCCFSLPLLIKYCRNVIILDCICSVEGSVSTFLFTLHHSHF